MKIKLIEKIKQFFENRKLKKLPDEVLIEKVEEKLEEDEVGEIPNIVKYVGDNDTQLQMAKGLVEGADINIETKKEVIDNLPHITKKELFRESIKTKEIIAQKDMPTFIKILINEKKLQPYDELYYRVDKAFSDSELGRILGILYKERTKEYDEEKVLRIVAKQMLVDMKKYNTFLPSHFAEIANNIIIDEGTENERTFQILNEEDKEKLEKALEEESIELKENSKKALTAQEKAKIAPEKIQQQINNIVEFSMKRQKELQEQETSIR